MRKSSPVTSLCSHDTSSIHIRGKSLCEELIGKVSFTEMAFLNIFGRMPSEVETTVLDAMMVTLMEHGLAPSAIATRLTYSSSPEAIQGAVAAGLLGAGSVMLGTLGKSAILLQKIVSDSEGIEAAALREARWHKENCVPVPGFGHPYHKPDDPRSIRLFALADELGLEGKYIAACRALGASVDEVYGKHLTINASAAMGALLSEINVPPELMQGFAIISRSAGLVAHIAEEMIDPAAWTMMIAADKSVPYREVQADASSADENN